MNFDFFDDEGYVTKAHVKKSTLIIAIPFYIFCIVIMFVKDGFWWGITGIVFTFFAAPSIFLFPYYRKEIYTKLGWNVSTFYSSEALWFLSMSPMGIFIILFATVTPIFTTMAITGLLLTIPFLGVGLRFKSFNDESRGDEYSNIGYHPFLYLIAALFVSIVLWSIVFYQPWIIYYHPVIILVALACYLWIFFPDVLNNVLPFDNRTLIGFIAYIGFILVFFVLCIKIFVPGVFYGWVV